VSKNYYTLPRMKLLFLIFLLISVSCVTQKNIEYLQDQDKNMKAYEESSTEDYQLKPNDELYIQISSLDEAAANIFSGTSSERLTVIGSIEPYGAYLLAYSIDSDGNLNLPYVGKLPVKGKTIENVTELIENSLDSILSFPVVSVKLVNRYISVLGEVRQPGHFAFAQEKMTIYDALGMAGDITDFGNRKEIILIRNENGENKRIPVNLLNSDILASSLYYLQPNDIIYVKPMHKKFWDLRQFPYTVILSTITTAILIYSIK
jgi:polysaccharide biosynthesis/export protein